MKLTTQLTQSLAFISGIQDRIIKRHQQAYTNPEAGMHTTEKVFGYVVIPLAALVALYMLGTGLYRVFFG